MTGRPGNDEAAHYYSKYIDRVPDGDVVVLLERQLEESMELWRTISEERSLHRYAPEKWSIRQVLSHINDTERVFVFRAFWFGRGFDAPMPSFDQEIAATAARADERSWASHVDEFKAIRASTLALFRDLPEDSWARRGIASDNPVSVRALAYITAGHAAHHAAILKERYLTAD